MISASWTSTDAASSNYKYNVTLIWDTQLNFTGIQILNNINLSNLEPGTKYKLSVYALVNDSVKGDAATIDAYTSKSETSSHRFFFLPILTLSSSILDLHLLPALLSDTI